MTLTDFEGDTFVAFTDISGFKTLMKMKKAGKVLDAFYSNGYRVLREHPNLNGLFISDCGIIFVKDVQNIKDRFFDLLKMIESLNSSMLDEEVMLTTSIAFGEFSYHNKMEFPGIEKNAIIGYAYLEAYLSNESKEPKLKPGQCRIVSNNLPQEIIEAISIESHWRIRKNGKYFYYYWMISDDQKISKITNDYQDTQM